MRDTHTDAWLARQERISAVLDDRAAAFEAYRVQLAATERAVNARDASLDRDDWYRLNVAVRAEKDLLNVARDAVNPAP